MYLEMFEFVESCFVNECGRNAKAERFPFRKRSEHIRRVFMWAERLIDSEYIINKEAVLTSAIFHDVGYAISTGNSEHAENSAILCEKYLKEKGFPTEFIDLVVYLVKNHSNKNLMAAEDTPLELILLMEADLLDETGALSIVWDCMMEGAQQEQSFEKTYKHIKDYSCRCLNENPMITAKAKEFWENKQRLMEDFITQLSFDLFRSIDSELIPV